MRYEFIGQHINALLAAAGGIIKQHQIHTRIELVRVGDWVLPVDLSLWERRPGAYTYRRVHVTVDIRGGVATTTIEEGSEWRD